MSLKRRCFSIFYLAASGTIILSCTKGVPNIEDMGNLAGFSVDQSQVRGNPFQLTGGCSSQFTGVSISLDNGSNWKSVTEYSTDFAMNCSSSGSYSGHLTFPSAVPSFLVRGLGPLGASSSYVVAMSAIAPLRPQVINAGATNPANPSSGGGYKLRGAITYEGRAVSSQATLTGSSYKIKGAAVGL